MVTIEIIKLSMERKRLVWIKQDIDKRIAEIEIKINELKSEQEN
jgi:hypothetical protein